MTRPALLSQISAAPARTQADKLLNRVAPLLVLLAGLSEGRLHGQDVASAVESEARTLIQNMKAAERGPFSRIRWFCADGEILPPKPFACAEHGGGAQHGELSSDAHRLAELGYNPGTLFVSLSFDDFFDAGRNYARLREIVLHVYLERADDGWIFRRARYYRGSRQAEDEDVAGARLLSQLLADTAWVRKNFLLAVELVRAVPHGRGPAQLDVIRALAGDIGDADAEFHPLRVKIHSYPGADDIQSVERFVEEHPDLSADLRSKLGSLLAALRSHYMEDPRARLEQFRALDDEGAWSRRITDLDRALASASQEDLLHTLAAASAEIRREATSTPDGDHVLQLLDLNLTIQELLARTANGLMRSWPSRPLSRLEALHVAGDLVIGTFGRGLLSERESQAQIENLARHGTSVETAAGYQGAAQYLQRSVFWTQNAVAYFFGAMLDHYLLVEATAGGFPDDLLRSTVILPLAELTDRLGRDANRELGLTHVVFGETTGEAIFGLNPGVATGTLRYVPRGELHRTRYRSDEIYILSETFAELPPVAGVLTLSEGSSVSHLQLLARSMGIPNSLITTSALERMRPHFGEEVLYAVTPMGAVLLKETRNLTPGERRLVAEKEEAPAPKVSIDPRDLALDSRHIVSLEEIDPTDPGKTVGPKAAGVAMLHRRFPERVSPGIAIPFGAFRAHLNRRDSPDTPSLYEELVEFYRQVRRMEMDGRSVSEIEAFIDHRLVRFRNAIVARDFDPHLVEELRERLAELGEEGTFGVFVRSDTNVEDLAQFSGAGLNLTVPNRVRFDDILEAIKLVWASPFTKRAYGWRKPIIDTPEHIYVSVLIQRTVPVEKSGVLISADLVRDRPGWITISASEGFGGAVSGELAESLLVPPHGEPELVAQAKAPFRQRSRTDEEGGVEWVPTSGSDYVLSRDEIHQLSNLVKDLERTLEPALDSRGQPMPWDVEFGFLAGKLWLFQVRPLARDSRTEALETLNARDRRARERGNHLVNLNDLVT